MIDISGHIETITYYNKDNHYTIAKFKVEDQKSFITVVGYLPDAAVGETLKISGVWDNHIKYGQQFKIEIFEVLLPASVNAIKKYLGSGIIKGIGPAMAKKITKKFKTKTLEIIEKHPEKLCTISGIGKSKALVISNSWQKHHAIRSLMQFLQDNGVDASTGSIILKEYGTVALELVKNNPYIIVKNIPAKGFFIADTIGQNLNIPKEDKERLKACILFVMMGYENNGDVFAYEEQLNSRCSTMLGVDNLLVTEAIELLIKNKSLVRESLINKPEISVIYRKELHNAEKGIAQKIKALLSISISNSKIDTEQIIEQILQKLAIKLSSEQLDVLENVLIKKLVIITGGPGTGKTTLVRSIVSIFSILDKTILLAAPTGRAARRLAEVTGEKTSTIHKLLQYNLITGKFDKNQYDPLEADIIIVDEASMIDTDLMYHLLNAIPANSRFIMVGDIFQLPSVGPGNVLSDMISSKKIETFELTKIFRQAKESPIVVNAHKIRKGEFPDFKFKNKDTDLSDFYFSEQNNPQKVVDIISGLCHRRIPKSYPHLTEIQVLTPMHKGDVGTINLNMVLQNVLNPGENSVKGRGCFFRIGDKVMHLKNNYTKDVFNGDIGNVSHIDKSHETLFVDYDGRDVEYDFSELDELTLAYAISVHKSQGSEYPAVIIPIMNQHFPLLQKNLLYTAITRGKGLVIIIGTREAVNIALNNDKPMQRLSSLAQRL